MSDPSLNSLPPHVLQELYRHNPEMRPGAGKDATPLPDVPVGGPIPADLAPYWGKQIKKETVYLGRWATANPRATAQELEQTRWAVQLQLAVEEREAAARRAQRLAAASAAERCPCCGEHALDVQQINRGERDLDGRLDDPVYAPTPGQHVDVNGPTPVLACRRCRPVIAAAATAWRAAELVNGRPRGDLAHDHLTALWGPPAGTDTGPTAALTTASHEQPTGAAGRTRRRLLA